MSSIQPIFPLEIFELIVRASDDSGGAKLALVCRAFSEIVRSLAIDSIKSIMIAHNNKIEAINGERCTNYNKIFPFTFKMDNFTITGEFIVECIFKSNWSSSYLHLQGPNISKSYRFIIDKHEVLGFYICIKDSSEYGYDDSFESDNIALRCLSSRLFYHTRQHEEDLKEIIDNWVYDDTTLGERVNYSLAVLELQKIRSQQSD